MVDASIVAGVVFAGVVLGSFGRAMFPYLRKLKEEEDTQVGGREQPIKFQRKYVYTAVFSAIVSLILGMTLFPALFQSATDGLGEGTLIVNGTQITEEDVDRKTDDFTPLAGIFMSAFLTAWGSSSIINNIIATGKSTNESIQPGSLRRPALADTTSSTTTTTEKKP